MTLSSLLYASTAKPELTSEEIGRIVETATRVNAELEVTGVLAFDGKGFTQILEGETAVVEDLMNRIKRDPRHFAFVVLSRREIAQRRFKDWTMAYRQLSDLIMIQDMDE